MHLRFWNELAADCPDPSELQEVCLKVDISKNRISTLATLIFRHSPNNVYVHQLYGRYLVDIEMNVPEGKRLLSLVSDL
jgi:hypothetical protein